MQIDFVKKNYYYLIEEIEKYKPDCDKKFLRKVFLFAQKAHHNQIRKSGDPYILHPLMTAINCSKIKLDELAIAGALLHDILEDTSFTLNDLVKLFGHEVGQIVEGLTKLEKLEFQVEQGDRYIETYKKLFFGAGKDIRIILIKICDRLHNLETLDYLEPSRRIRMATESLEIYVPLLYLLSLGKFIGKIEDLCLKFYDTDLYQKIIEKINLQHDFYLKKISDTIDLIQHKIKEQNLTAKITGKIKNYYSFYKKIKDKNLPLDIISEVILFKVIVQDISQCYLVLGILHSTFKVKFDRFQDYISSPKTNGYKCVHTTLFDNDGELLEFQILTQELLDINDYGIGLHLQLVKNSLINQSITPNWIKNILELQKGNPDPSYFYQKLKDEVLSESIICFSTNGTQIELPIGATLLDFAYKFNIEAGNHFIGAYINGTYITNPMTKLNSGDIINVLSGKNINKSFLVDYISIIKTNLAREQLKRFFQDNLLEKRKFGKYLLNEKLKLLGLSNFEDMDTKIKKSILTRFNFSKIDFFYDNIGMGNFDLNRIIVYLSEFYGKKEIIKKVNLKIYLKVDKILSFFKILNVFLKLNIELINIQYSRQYVTVSFYILDFMQLHTILLEFKSMQNVIKIKRTFPLRLLLFYIIFLIFALLILSQPLLIRYFSEKNSNYIENLNLFFILSYIFMLLIIFLFKYLIKLTLPDRFNYKRFWVAMIILNTFIIFTLMQEIYYFKLLNNNRIILSVVGIMMYSIIGYEYYNYKKELLFC